MSIWGTLGIAATRDRTAIRRAYSTRLKVTNPEDDPQGFQTLRAAYEQALAMAAQAEYAAQLEAEDETSVGAPEPAWEAEPAEPAEAEPGPAPAAQPWGPGPQAHVTRAEIEVVERALGQLAEAVNGPEPDGEAAKAAFAALIAAPALDSVTVRDQVEGHVASIILHGGRGAGHVIDQAIEAFGWRPERLGGQGELAEAVAARRADLVLLAALRRRDSTRHRAYKALSTPPQGARLWRWRLSPGLTAQVRGLLEEIDRRRGSLLGELDPEAVAWWRHRLAQPHLGPTATWAVVLVPLLAATVAADEQPYGLSGWAGWGAAYATMMGGLAALWGAWVFGLFPARRRWRERAEEAPAWQSLGWAPLALANLAAAAVVPAADYPWAFGVSGLAIAAWALVTAPADPDGPQPMVWSLPFSWLPLVRIPAMTPRWVTLALGLAAVLVFWWFVGSNGEFGAARAQASLAAAAAGAAFVAGHETLEAAWLDLSSQIRTGLLAGLAALAAAMPFWLWATAPGPAYAALAGAGVTGVVLLERVAALRVDRQGWRSALYRWGWLPMLAVYSVVEEAQHQGNALLLGLGVWLMAGAAAGLVRALRQEREARAYAR